jgi:hypothetical protein
VNNRRLVEVQPLLRKSRMVNKFKTNYLAFT